MPAPTAPTTMPEFPALSNRVNYNQLAFDWAKFMRVTYTSEMFALANNTYSNASAAAVSAAAAATSAGAVAGQVTLATNKANDAATSAGAAVGHAGNSAASAIASQTARVGAEAAAGAATTSANAATAQAVISATKANEAAASAAAASAVSGLPNITGKPRKIIRVNAGATAYELSDSILGIYASPATLAAAAIPDDGALVIITGHGMFRYSTASTRIADSETCIVPAAGAGRWLLEAPAWNFIWSYLAPVFDDLQEQADAAQRFTATASLDFPSIAAGTASILTINLPGARPGADLIVTPPANLAAQISVRGYIETADVATIVASNLSTGAIDPASGVYRVTTFGE